MTTAEVMDAQRRLGLRVTGVQDDELYHAVRAFQLERGVLVTGVLDAATRQLLWETRIL